ncbi:hypothetical protein J4447_03110 [Candidatus Pacearchaeota archaeon]|nr:hypothetical protein [Candidatus Pacearchaeota archaeon]
MARDLPLNEVILRKYEKPYSADRREIVKKICLSLGLLQPGDSRDIIIDILSVLIDSQKKKEMLTSDEIKLRVENIRKNGNFEMRGIAESNIRRQLKRLADMMLIDKLENKYRLSEFETLENIFHNKFEKFIIPQTIERIKEYLKAVEEG